MCNYVKVVNIDMTRLFIVSRHLLIILVFVNANMKNRVFISYNCILTYFATSK